MRLKTCQWNWTVASATAAFDWYQSDLPTPCKSTKSRLLDAEITKGRRSLHLSFSEPSALLYVASLL